MPKCDPGSVNPDICTTMPGRKNLIATCPTCSRPNRSVAVRQDGTHVMTKHDPMIEGKIVRDASPTTKTASPTIPTKRPTSLAEFATELESLIALWEKDLESREGKKKHLTEIKDRVTAELDGFDAATDELESRIEDAKVDLDRMHETLKKTA